MDTAGKYHYIVYYLSGKVHESTDFWSAKRLDKDGVIQWLSLHMIPGALTSVLSVDEYTLTNAM